ncbi:MAG: NAD(P)H-dependent oxidoreductase [Bacteroidota bacterium]
MIATPTRIVCISGTNRPGNYTAFALGVVERELQARGATTTLFDTRTLTLAFPGSSPTPDGVALQDAIEEADGVVLATPEYHGTFAAMTKLVIENLGYPSKLAAKPMALVGVASGRIGAIKSLEQLRGVCAHVGALVLPSAISIAGVRKAFTDEGVCTDPQVEEVLQRVATSLLSFIETYVRPKQILEASVRTDGGPWITRV